MDLRAQNIHKNKNRGRLKQQIEDKIASLQEELLKCSIDMVNTKDKLVHHKDFKMYKHVQVEYNHNQWVSRIDSVCKRSVITMEKLNYATTVNIINDRCYDMPLEKRMSVKILHLRYATQISQNSELQEELCKIPPLQQHKKVSVIEVNYVEPVFVVLLSEFCLSIINEGDTKRKISHVMTQNYGTLNDLDIYEDCSELIQQNTKFVNVELKSEKVLAATTKQDIPKNPTK